MNKDVEKIITKIGEMYHNIATLELELKLKKQVLNGITQGHVKVISKDPDTAGELEKILG